MESLPEEIRQLLNQYEDCFCEKLPKGRKMQIDQVDIKINKEMENALDPNLSQYIGGRKMIKSLMNWRQQV